MADRLEWMNRHMVLFRHLTLKDAVEREKYKPRPDLAAYAPEGVSAQGYLQNLYDAGKFKEGCDFLAYVLHRRAAIWWGYRCLLTLCEELGANPAAERDIADIAAPREMPVPDWARMPSEAPDPEEVAAFEQTLAQVQADNDRIQAMVRKMVPPEIQSLFDGMIGAIDANFRKAHGHSMREVAEKAVERMFERQEIDPESPVFVATRELEEQIEAKRKETVDLIKSVLPPRVPEHERKVRDDAMRAIYRWVCSPDEVNSKAALDAGNECPDQPAGMMAMAAFWSYGDLDPVGEQVVPTPAGLAANGICASLLQAALAKGGTRKYVERCRLYLELGFEVALGRDNWADSLRDKEAPHERIVAREPPSRDAGMPSGQGAPGPSADGSDGREARYRKWTPEGRGGA